MTKPKVSWKVQAWSFPADSIGEALLLTRSFPTAHKAVAAVDRIFRKLSPEHEGKKLTVSAYKAEHRYWATHLDQYYTKRNFTPVTMDELARLIGKHTVPLTSSVDTERNT